MRRARATAPRRLTKFNVPATIGIPDAPRKETLRELRRDILGPLIAHHHPVVPDQTRASMMAAFDKRCNYHSSQRVDPSIIQANRLLLERISPKPWDPLVHDRALFEDWNAQFDTAKQNRHKKAYLKIAELTARDFSDKQIFVKVEALLKRHDPNWAPRIIYQSSDLHNVVLGPVMWKCTKRMFQCFDHVDDSGGVHYMGAYAKQTPELTARITRHATAQTMFLESDFSSNDMTQLEDVHMLEIQWLRHFGAPAWITALMHVANSFRAVSYKHKIKAKISNQLPTGAQSTTFRNSLWNATINYAFCLKHNLRGDCLILGDDMLFRCDNPFSKRRRNLRREYEHIVKLAGMDGKVAVYDHLSECSFLSKQFIMTDNGYVMAPKLGKALARFNVRASSNEAVSDSSYIAGKALSYAFEFRFVRPISRCFLLRYAMEECDDPSLDGLGWNAKGAFLRLGVEGVLSAIDNARTCSRADMTRFYHWRYGMTATDVILKTHAFLFGDRDLEPDEVGFLTSDFL